MTKKVEQKAPIRDLRKVNGQIQPQRLVTTSQDRLYGVGFKESEQKAYYPASSPAEAIAKFTEDYGVIEGEELIAELH